MYSNYRKTKSVQYYLKAEERARGQTVTDLCYKCGFTGHISKNCTAFLN
jgi:hypothetical protein